MAHNNNSPGADADVGFPGMTVFSSSVQLISGCQINPPSLDDHGITQAGL